MSEIELIERIERAALWAWPPKETARVDGWLLRADGGDTRRANSVQTLVFAADSDLDRAIGPRRVLVCARGLPACFQLTDRSAPARLDAMLDARGYARLPSVSVFLRRPGRGRGHRDRADRAPDPADAAGHERGLRPLLGAGRTARPRRAVRPHPPAARVRRPARGQPAGRRGPVRRGRRARRDLHAANGGAGARPRPWPCGAAPPRRLGRGMAVPSRSISRSRTTTCRRRHCIGPLAARRAYGYWYREAGAQAA